MGFAIKVSCSLCITSEDPVEEDVASLCIISISVLKWVEVAFGVGEACCSSSDADSLAALRVKTYGLPGPLHQLTPDLILILEMRSPLLQSRAF